MKDEPGGPGTRVASMIEGFRVEIDRFNKRYTVRGPFRAYADVTVYVDRCPDFRLLMTRNSPLLWTAVDALIGQAPGILRVETEDDAVDANWVIETTDATAATAILGPDELTLLRSDCGHVSSIDGDRGAVRARLRVSRYWFSDAARVRAALLAALAIGKRAARY